MVLCVVGSTRQPSSSCSPPRCFFSRRGLRRCGYRRCGLWVAGRRGAGRSLPLCLWASLARISQRMPVCCERGFWKNSYPRGQFAFGSLGPPPTECLILRPRAMQAVSCAAGHGQQRRQAVARRDSMAAIRRIPMKTSKMEQKRIVKTRASLTAHWHDKGADWREQKRKSCGGPWDPISPPHGCPLGPPRPPRDVERLIYV